MRKPPRPESFERFYYTKVGLGEACGCAEKIIDVYEFNRRAGDQAAGHYIRRGGVKDMLRAIGRKLGLAAKAG